MGYSSVEFPKDTKFLVTGAAGFIGSNLVEALLKLGYRVRGLDNLSTGKMENADELLNYPNYEFVRGDIRDFDTCLNACEKIDFVLNQAALGSVPRSMKDPIIYEDNNIKGTANMMEAARIKGVKRFIYASSSSVFGDSITLPKKEGQEGNILSPYALTKYVNEQYGKLYTNTFGLECIGLRYFNVFGRRQDPYSIYAAVIPNFIRALKRGEQVEIHGDGEQSRDFTYIENVIEANLKACVSTSKSCGYAYNIAYGQRYTINQIYDLICRSLKVNIKPMYVSERPGDIKHSMADITNAREMLNYDPSWDFVTGLSEAIKWYLENLN